MWDFKGNFFEDLRPGQRLINPVPRTITTGDVVNPDAEGFLQDSGCAYLSKPFKLETILAVVDQAARRKAA